LKLARFVEGSRVAAGLVIDEHIDVYDSLGSDPFGDFVDQYQPDEMGLDEFIKSMIEDQDSQCQEVQSCLLASELFLWMTSHSNIAT
jgi:hypothetical protein